MKGIRPEDSNGSDETAAFKGKPSGGPRRFARQAVGYLVAAACLVWVFHDIDARRIISQVSKMNWGWVLVGISCDFLSYLSQGYRWQLLLRPVGSISVVRTTQAIYSGLFTNEILPLRTGELVRGYLVSRWLGVGFVSVMPSVMVERFFDAIWLGTGVAITALLVSLPENLMRAADILGALVLILIAIFIYLVFRKEKEPDKKPENNRPRRRIFGKIGSLLGRLAGGIKAIGTSSSFYWALGASSLFIVFQVLALWFVMIGYGIPVPLWTGAAVVMILLLGVAIPNAPSNIGTYQFFIVVGLTLFGVDKTTASGFSAIAFLVLTVPLWLVGSLAIAGTGMKFRDIRREISKLVGRTQAIGA